MRYRRFGRLGWSLGEVGVGMWGMGSWTGSDDDESLSSLQLALDLGCNFFDTAFAYGDGHSERLLGQLVRSNPDRTIYVATCTNQSHECLGCQHHRCHSSSANASCSGHSW
jgi:aryl-alcohol dehydrogenase-like predicted oxidoreductase